MFVILAVSVLIGAFYMEYTYRKKCKAADVRFDMIMKSLEEKAKRNKENK